MFKPIRKLLTIGALVISMAVAAQAAITSHYPIRQIENWHNEGMFFVIRDAHGQIVTHARGHLEKWKSEVFQVWVVRDSGGRFLTYLHGSIERWTDGTKGIVRRDKAGKFVAVGSAIL